MDEQRQYGGLEDEDQKKIRKKREEHTITKD
jgi:hypothetical protein